MNPSSTGPADTAMMGIVHSALRRDLTRTATALSAEPPPGHAQRTAIAAHLVWMMDFLHRHHEGEDAGLWPLVRSLNPAAGDLLDQMENDHAAISPEMSRLSTATDQYAKDPSVPAREGVEAALTSLRVVLDPHLLREENEMMPVVSATLTHGQWEAFNQEHDSSRSRRPSLAQRGIGSSTASTRRGTRWWLATSQRSHASSCCTPLPAAMRATASRAGDPRSRSSRFPRPLTPRTHRSAERGSGLRDR